MTFGEKIKYFRQLADMTQQDLADKTGVSLRTIINYENHNKTPKKISTYAAFAEVFNVDPDFLYKSKEDDYKIILELEEVKCSVDKCHILLSHIASIFNDRSITSEAKDEIYEGIQELYWSYKFKEKAKKKKIQ